MGCFTSSSVRKSPVLQPIAGNNSTANHSKVATGVLNNNNGFVEDTHVLRQVQNIESPKIYRTDQLKLSSDEYNLVNNSLFAMSFALSGLSKVHHARNLRPDVYNVKDKVERELNFQTNYSNKFKRESAEADSQGVDCNKPLFKNAREKMALAADLLGNKDKLLELTKNPEAEIFFNTHKFDTQLVYFFNTRIIKIAQGDTPKNPQYITLGDRNLLRGLVDDYACKGIIENQLPKVKQHFSKMQGKLDKDFLTIVGKAIQSIEIGLKNINNSDRAAILEKISPELRPMSYGKHVNPYSVFKDQKSVLDNKTDAEIADIFRQLKEIPILLP